MFGYNVSFHVNRAKNPYNSTEFYSTEKQAVERATELAIASNIDVIIITTINYNMCGFNVVKGRGKLEYTPPELDCDETFNEKIQEMFSNSISKKWEKADAAIKK